MRLLRGLLIVVTAVFLLVGVMACSSAQPAEEPSESSPAESEEQAVEQADEESGIADWFEGRWIVDFSLTSVSPDADWSRAAADQASAEWSCQVNGSEMVIDAGLHVYTGTLVADGDGWNYDGTATYLDEEGVEWTSHIVVEGTRESEEAFQAEQWGEIASDAEGTLYVATWDAIGTRVE